MDSIDQATALLENADALIVAAGAGMGVDSGLPDFRGDEGFWNAYPPFSKLGLKFVDLADPRWFEDDPALAWGFYGHRMHLYRDVVPHAGFTRLLRWGQGLPGGLAVFTSNVDGQFHRAGFPLVCEVHGSIHHLQCVRACHEGIWSADQEAVMLDESTMRAQGPLPSCPRCGGLARPNVLMFGDGDWVGQRTRLQHNALRGWLAGQQGRILVIECGAGTAVPTVRWFSERLLGGRGADLVRINPRESEGPTGTVSLAMGAEAATRGIEAARLALRG